jgi:hypothetical protein
MKCAGSVLPQACRSSKKTHKIEAINLLPQRRVHRWRTSAVADFSLFVFPFLLFVVFLQQNQK